MGLETIILPPNPDHLAKVIQSHVRKEETRLRWRRLVWTIAWYYLNGARRFEVLDHATGNLYPYMLDDAGNMEFQANDLLFLINKNAAKLGSMDFRPRVTSPNMGLESIRQRSVMQVIMEALVGGDHLAQVKRDFCYIFTCLGSCGITGHIQEHPVAGLESDLEVVHPRELLPFPAMGQDHTKLRGMVRRRLVPISTLVDIFGDKVKKNLDRMEVYERAPADLILEPLSAYDFVSSSTLTTGTPDPTGQSQKTKETVLAATINELWQFGPRGRCLRYCATSLDYTMDDTTFEGEDRYCPVGFARFFETGTFHGAGLFDVMYHVARQMELLLKSLFNNIRDTDRYGVMVMPVGQFAENAVLRDVGNGLRVLPWEPDPATEGYKPFNITPFSLGDVPGKVAAFAKTLLYSLDPTGDLVKDKGRVDSAQGLALLDEQIGQALTHPSQGCERAWGVAYKGLAAGALDLLLKTPQKIPVSRLTLDLAGAVISMKDGTISFENNPVPDPSRLTFTIRELSPKTETARKQAALALNTQALTDRDALIIYSILNGLELEMWMEPERAAVESIIRNILTLYGDGDTPGDIMQTPYMAVPGIQIRILQAFMASPTMSYASPTVIDEFQFYLKWLQTQMSPLPQGVPSPEETLLPLEQGGGGGPFPFPGGQPALPPSRSATH